ncbi:MAG: efflux RND transporter periplasmic adaptor subunit [Gammaproteobacteria bacterium]|nr:efflux RND transporter periplasmic adaptor subunit [Gammaproteobacteria bacterium]
MVTQNSTTPDSSGDIDQLIGDSDARPWWRRPGPWSAGALIVAVIIGILLWQGHRRADALPGYMTSAVTRGDLTVQVTANGILQPTNQVDIGSELSGTVARVLVDVNDRVKKGQVLVELDTAKLNDQVTQARAALTAAEATVRQAAATASEARDNLARLEEVSRLSGGQVPSQSELAAAQAALQRALADEASAGAGVAEARAALSSADTNLSKAAIRSPINGVVLARSVDPGNAVAASLQAVILFTLAEDLAQMKLEVNVDEADVGQVSEGQRATFTVSAYPNRDYPAAVTRVDYGSTTQDNVVTYVTVLAVDNADLSLRPGMTATAQITATERQGVLLVPNAALRFTPADGADTDSAPQQDGGGLVSSLMPRPPRTGVKSRTVNDRVVVGRQVWVLRDGTAVAVPVETGVSNGFLTEVRSEQLQPGMEVITGRRAAGAS